MRIEVIGETGILVRAAGDGLEIREREGGVFGPLEMLAASLATCTVAVLVGWAERAGLDTAELAVRLDWEYVDDPYRVGRYAMALDWPSLQEGRRSAARRVAAACTVKHTLAHPPEVDISFA